ncbi:MAG: nucleotidyltransferase [Deltaproteobacteria bacterium]|nr:MAG: nucleotidyltransferase [Deltaproteobacteria bacterium]
MSRDTNLYLRDMVEACSRIAEYADGRDSADIFGDRKRRDAILWNLLVLGEAAKGVPADVRARFPAIEWRKIAGFRDVLAHGYFGLDEDIVWDVIENKLPGLLTLLRDAAV